MNYKTQIHIKEMYTHPVYGRTFEGWLSGDALNVFGALAGTQCAMTGQQANAYRLAVEKRAFEWNNATKVTTDGKASDSTITLEYLPEIIETA